MGITNKTDGKSADGNMSDKFTQRSNDNDSYSEHDPTETIEYRKEQVGGAKFYFVLGVVGIVLGIMYLFSSHKMDLDYERDLVYQRMAEKEEDWRENQERLKARRGPFRDA